ncbi:hypothetical protein H8K35_02815 [Undibacterium sp. LX40W]|uniref:Tetratricopeptide repeat protein n=1 Tax=Undibacterium nitidum TaxID=2762298 RepID=A0A923HJR9_9BURK|nr:MULTISPECIES: hypothetical protein [Undibacterium]MBC3880684.1 hypothetical protein [Undibacterium nitidum]MBC3890581.1 hypothetical protein [Undibacterium sp. LX40W]
MRLPFKNTQSLPRLSAIAVAITVMAACSSIPFLPDQHATAPVLDGFGGGNLIPSKGNLAAQKLFAQGVSQMYGFNGDEAIRAFKAALAKDPECAMCAWGIANQMGPNINNPSRGDLTEAVKYVDYALKHSAGSSARDQALIESLALRYAHDSVKREVTPLMGQVCAVAGKSVERANPLDVAYADRMRKLVEQFPNDPDVLAIYAEAEMVATTEDWWDKQGKPGGRIGELATRIEAALKAYPNHTGLNHYMIHSVDAVQVAGRAEAAADRLGALAPKSPHLLHMPSHTYAQIGRYADATRVNQLAVAADEAMMVELKRQNFADTKDWRGHNRHFQWYGALMEGRGDLAIETARAAAAASTGDHEYGEYVRSLPILTLMYLQRWDTLQTESMPSGNHGVATALGEMARGTAYARKGDIATAKASLAKLEPAAAELIKKNTSNDYVGKLIRSIAGTAQHQLRAEIALAEKRFDDAIKEQNEAVTASNDADSTEPPTLGGATRRRLGMMQLQAKRFAEAEHSFRTDLKEHLRSGWSLQGLSNALIAQGKTSEAQAVKPELETSWKLADAALRQMK